MPTTTPARAHQAALRRRAAVHRTLQTVLALVTMLSALPLARGEECQDLHACERRCIQKDAAACTKIEAGLKALCDTRRVGPACSHLAVMFNSGGPLPLSLDRWVEYSRKACDLGDPSGCNELGVAYALGAGGLTQDNARAVELYALACAGDLGLGCRNYGTRLRLGLGVARDFEKARQALTRGCNLRDARACDELAQLYERGLGVPVDAPTALGLYEKACRLGDPGACKTAATLGGRSDGPGRVDLQALERSCDDGMSGDCVKLGNALADGVAGVPKDPARAFARYEQACARGWAVGCDLAGDKLVAGDGAPRDAAKARDRYEEACRRGNSASCASAGDISRDGTGGAVIDADLAIRLYRRGCAARHPYSCSALGHLLAQRERPEDLAEGRAALEQACAFDRAWACAHLADHLDGGTFGVPDGAAAKAYRERACRLGDRAACAPPR